MLMMGKKCKTLAKRLRKQAIKVRKAQAQKAQEAQKEDVCDMEKARRLVHEHIAEKRAEQLLAEQCYREQVAMEEESIDITPPRLRTPNRYRECDFEEAEQLVTPKSPEQAQFEFNQAATPRTPVSYVLPFVEEVDEEDERHIIDLTDSFREFL